METVYIAWVISAVILILSAMWIGRDAPGGGLLGILIDIRGRYSLTKFQITLWTILIGSLIAGLFFARWVEGVDDALGFSIPDQLLVVLGISVGSGAAATTIKASKDRKYPGAIAVSDANDKPRFEQIFLEEEGDYADSVVDIAKFQNFWFTILAVSAYTFLAIRAIETATAISNIALPSFNDTLLTVLGISHAGYLAGKLPPPSGSAPGLTWTKRRSGAVPTAGPAVPAVAPAGAVGEANAYVPRNP